MEVISIKILEGISLVEPGVPTPVKIEPPTNPFYTSPPNSAIKMSVAFCLPVGPDEAPCSTLFSHLYVEHAGGRGFFQYLSEDDLDAVASTCLEAEREIKSFRWYNFLRKVKQRVNNKETKEDYWISKVNSCYDHIPILEIVSVMEIEKDDGSKALLRVNKEREKEGRPLLKDKYMCNYIPNFNGKDYMVELMAENWINLSKDPLHIYVNFMVYDDEKMDAREDIKVARMDTYNFIYDAKIKDVLIDNRPSHVMSLREHSLNEQKERATFGERLLYDYT